jgi:tetraacyldisaccharide 4'-kinase
LYGVIIWIRNKFYDAGLFSSLSFDAIPVISVGNLSVGGTGKSPHIEYLVRLLSKKFHTATLSRGYGRSTKGFRIADDHADARSIGDEPYQFKRKFDNILVAVGEDRVTAIPELLQRAPYIETILLDDAFQHRSVKPGLNILLTEYNKPYTKDYILPLGRLREGRKAAMRADIIIVSKCPELTVAQKEKMLSDLEAESNQKVFFTKIEYDEPYPLLDNNISFNQETKAITFSGIANATPFINRVATLTQDVHELNYKDHHYFTKDDIQELYETFNYIKNENKCIFVTEKDATRLLLHKKLLQEYNLPIVVIPIRISFLFDEGTQFDQLLDEYVHSYFPVLEINDEEEINLTDLEVEYEEVS